MDHEAPYLRFDGADGDFIWFSFRSRSRDHWHTVTICKRTGWMACTCEDHEYRRKGSYVWDAHPYLCFHAGQVRRVCLPILRVFFPRLRGDQ